jgi:hypothetical protein
MRQVMMLAAVWMSLCDSTATLAEDIPEDLLTNFHTGCMAGCADAGHSASYCGVACDCSKYRFRRDLTLAEFEAYLSASDSKSDQSKLPPDIQWKVDQVLAACSKAASETTSE